MSRFAVNLFVGIVGLSLWSSSCKHDPFIMEDLVPVDTTTNPVDTTTNPVDTSTVIPCNPDVVYFESDLLPILQSNCALSGCHDAVSHQEGIILDSYASVMASGKVKPFDPGESKIYRKVTDNDPGDIMPPPPNTPLTAEQINILEKWILQGAENKTCDPDAGQCNTVNVGYMQTIKPILQNKCVGCHSGNTPSGGVDLSTYTGVKTVAQNGKLVGVISHLTGFPKMPQGGNQLPQCEIDKIKSWVDAGALNN